MGAWGGNAFIRPIPAPAFLIRCTEALLPPPPPPPTPSFSLTPPCGMSASRRTPVRYPRERQNRDFGMGRSDCIPESLIPQWMDLVIWGHEHKCEVGQARVGA